MLRILLLLTFCLGCFATSGFCQKTEIQEDIVRLLELTGADKMAKQMADQMMPSFKRAYPDLPDKFWEECRKEINKGELYDLIVPIYEKYYTHEDILQLIEFYNTPIGQKTIELMPTVMQESMIAGQKWGEEIGEEIGKRIMEESNIKIIKD